MRKEKIEHDNLKEKHKMIKNKIYQKKNHKQENWINVDK